MINLMYYRMKSLTELQLRKRMYDLSEDESVRLQAKAELTRRTQNQTINDSFRGRVTTA